MNKEIIQEAAEIILRMLNTKPVDIETIRTQAYLILKYSTEAR